MPLSPTRHRVIPVVYPYAIDVPEQATFPASPCVADLGQNSQWRFSVPHTQRPDVHIFPTQDGDAQHRFEDVMCQRLGLVMDDAEYHTSLHRWHAAINTGFQSARQNVTTKAAAKNTYDMFQTCVMRSGAIVVPYSISPSCDTLRAPYWRGTDHLDPNVACLPVFLFATISAHERLHALSLLAQDLTLLSSFIKPNIVFDLPTIVS